MSLLALTSGASLEMLALASRDGKTWLDNPVLTGNLWPATVETLLMTLTSGALAVVIGLPIGLLLVATGPGGMLSKGAISRPIYLILGFVVNVGRSLPFVILMISVIPLTRLIVGSILGWQGAVLPLSLAAAPFFARLVESNIQSVNAGKIEAAKMAGASPNQIMWGVQVREALPALIQSITVTLISLIGYGAIAGALGTGGLGALALNYGYQRFMGDVMLVTVVVILVIVMIVQLMGDMLSRLVDHR